MAAPPDSASLVPAVSRWRRWLAAGRGRWLGVVVSGAFVGTLLLMPDPGPLPAMRFGAFDFYQTHFPRVRKSAPAVIIAIDEASLAAGMDGWVTASDGPAFDADALLARLDGDRQLMAELVEMLRQQIPSGLSEIRRCVEGGDVPALQRIAHKLRGVALLFGARDAAAAALALEGYVRAGTTREAGFQAGALEQELARLLRDLGPVAATGRP